MLKKWMLVLLTSFVFAMPVAAQMAFVEGVDYRLIEPAVPTSDPAKVVVTEIFWYGCPHCFRFEPFVEKWTESIPDGVVFEQVPSAINAAWTVHARAYYSFKIMGVQEQLHKKLFDAIHVQRQRLNSLDSIAGFVAEQGLDEKEFRKQYASFPVETLIRKGKQKELKYGLEGVPTIIVNGKYRTSGVMAGNFSRLLQIIDFLVANELKG